MISRLHLEDWRIILHYMGMLVLLMAFVMVVPLCIALILHELDAAVIFIKCIGITLTCGGLLIFAKVERAHMDWRQALMVTAFSWVVLSFFGTLPLWMSGHYSCFTDAFFEGVSGLTASGFTLALDIDHMAYAFISWRMLLHLMGGIGVLVIALALGLMGSGASAASVYSAEARGDHVMPEIKQTSRFIARVTGTLIIFGAVACFIPMMLMSHDAVHSGFNAVWYAVSAFCTGGMLSSSMGIMSYHCWPLEILTMLIMFFGCINFILYGDIWRGRVRDFFKDIEIRTLAVWIALLIVLIMFALMMGESVGFKTIGAMIRRALFMIISAATNTGFSTVYPGQIPYVMGSGALFVLILALMVGGSASSTTGGIKTFRIAIIFKAMVQTVREALAPDSVQPRTFYYHQGRKVLTADLSSSILTIFLLYIATSAVGTILGIIFGYDALASIFDSCSATANAGLSLGVISAGMPKPLETVYIVQMLLGRLEFIALFAMVVQLVRSVVPRRKEARGRRKRGGRS